MSQQPKPPTFSTRLWSEEVARADARAGVPPPVDRRKEGGGYEFSGNRRFDDARGAYERPAPDAP